MTRECQAIARDFYNKKTKRFTLRFRPDELELYEKLMKDPAPGALIKELLDRHFLESEA